MQNIGQKVNPAKAVRIRYNFWESLVLYFTESYESVWLRERIFALLKRAEGEPVRSSLFTTVLKFTNPVSCETFYFKEFRARGVKDMIRIFFGFTRGRRDVRGGQLISECGFLTPETIVYGVWKNFLMKKDFMITREVPGERTYQYFSSRFSSDLSRELVVEKRALLKAAGHEIGRLHRCGICHGDLRVGNIIIDGKGSAARFFFVDNEKTRYYKILPKKKRFKNLVQLNMVLLPQLTKPDRLRFFNAYVEENTHLLPKKNDLIKNVYRTTWRRHREKAGAGDNCRP